MGSLSKEKQLALRTATIGAAEALVEDLERFRRVAAARNTSRVELRSLCADIRRLLVERELAEIAAPRIGKLELVAPDFHDIYAIAKNVKYVQFFGGSGTQVFGLPMLSVGIMNAGNPDHHGRTVQQHVAEALKPLERPRRIKLRLDNFLAQKVLCFENQWISRGASIKHIAYIASGVHSGTALTQEDQLISRLRKTCSYKATGAGIELSVSKAFQIPDWEFKVRHDDQVASDIDSSLASVDPVLIELLTAAVLVSESPSVIELEKFIRAELA